MKLEGKDKTGKDVYRGDTIKHIDTNNLCKIVYEEDCHYALDEQENMYFKLYDLGEPLFEVVE
jgi:hypothetical protein